MIRSYAKETRREEVRGRKGSLEGFPGEGAAELGLQGKAEESARQMRGQKAEQERGTEGRAGTPLTA